MRELNVSCGKLMLGGYTSIGVKLFTPANLCIYLPPCFHMNFSGETLYLCSNYKILLTNFKDDNILICDEHFFISLLDRCASVNTTKSHWRRVKENGWYVCAHYITCGVSGEYGSVASVLTWPAGCNITYTNILNCFSNTRGDISVNALSNLNKF